VQKLYIYATVVVLAHAAVVVWHLQILARLNPSLTREQALLFAVLANLVPLTTLALLWANIRKLGAWVLLGFLVIPLAIAAAGEWSLVYQVSAVLLVILEILGGWVSIRILRAPSAPAGM
jgi:hypothetical protein